MKEAIITTNKQYRSAFVAGTVVSAARDGAAKYAITLKVPGRAADLNIYFWNEKLREGDDPGKKLIARADRAEKMKVRAGSNIIVSVNFDENDENKAYGRSIRYYDAYFGTKEGSRNYVFGILRNVEAKTIKDKEGNDVPIVDGSVFYGKDKDGKGRFIDVCFYGKESTDAAGKALPLDAFPEGGLIVFMPVGNVRKFTWEDPNSLEEKTRLSTFAFDACVIGEPASKKGAAVETAEDPE